MIMHNPRAAAHRYRQVHVDSATPGRLLDELFARALLRLSEAEGHIARKDAREKGRVLGQVLAIVSELQAALDASKAPEMCANLDALYRFVQARIVEASTRMDAAPLADAGRVLATLREAFQAAAKETA
jgi:flagellar protein FliS